MAIVGSGCAGIGALWALKHTDHDVHLFEADTTLGGHTNTVAFRHDDQKVNVDTGFIVYNTATYRQSKSPTERPLPLHWIPRKEADTDQQISSSSSARSA